MFKNNFKIILRSLWKNKLVSSINLLGLTIGIGCSLLLLMYVQYEYSYDDFMADGDRIYRLGLEQKGSNARKVGLSGDRDYQILRDNFSGLESVLKLRNNDYTISPGDEKENGVSVATWFSTENFFDFFSFPLLAGDAETVLADPNGIVLTENTARRLFGDEDPMGKEVTINASSFDKKMVVSGIAKTMGNSHIRFEAIIPWEMRAPDGRHIAQMWFQRSLYTYIKTGPGTNIEDITNQHNQPLVDAGQIEDLEFFFQPLDEMYLGSNDIQFLAFETGNGQTVKTLFFMAVIILLVACINYVNLQTAKGTQRSLEVGVRKVMGAKRGSLIKQFLAESFVLTFLASIIAVLLIDLSLPLFNDLTGKSFSITSLLGQGLATFLIGIMLITGLFSGIYPAFVLSSFKPSRVLKLAGSATMGGKNGRKVLMLVQFGISLFLVAVTYITFQQSQFIASKDLGFNKDQVITFSVSTKNMQNSIQAFRKELDQYTGIAATSLSTDVLGDGFTNNSGRVYTKVNPDLFANTTVFGVDHSFIETYDMEIVEGRSFQLELSSDSMALIVNEAMVRSLGLEDPLNTELSLFRSSNPGQKIIGVVKDFHFRGLHDEINPVAIRIAPRNIWNISVRMYPETIGETLDFIESKWNEFETEAAFGYRFIDQKFARFYENESRMLKAITFFSVISIVLTSLGLFGMTIFVVERKIKEIGIRKVLGASLFNINYLIFKEFGLVLLLAVMIACPLVYYSGTEWLSRFAYRIDLHAGHFVIPGLLTLVVIGLTVSFNSVKAARSNPVEALRNE